MDQETVISLFFGVVKGSICTSTSKISTSLLTTHIGINEPGPQTDKYKVQFSINYKIIKI